MNDVRDSITALYVSSVESIVRDKCDDNDSTNMITITTVTALVSMELMTVIPIVILIQRS